MEKIHALVNNSFRIVFVGLTVALFITSLFILMALLNPEPVVEKLGTFIIILEACFIGMYFVYIEPHLRENLTKLKAESGEGWIATICILGTIATLSKSIGLGLLTIGLAFLIYNLKNPVIKLRDNDFYRKEKKNRKKNIIRFYLVAIAGVAVTVLPLIEKIS